MKTGALSFSVRSPTRRSGGGLTSGSGLSALEQSYMDALDAAEGLHTEAPTSSPSHNDGAAGEALARAQRLSAQTKDLLRSLRLEQVRGDEDGDSTSAAAAAANLLDAGDISMSIQNSLYDALGPGVSTATAAHGRAASPPLPVRFTSLQRQNNSINQSLLSEHDTSTRSTYRKGNSFFSENAMAHSILQSMRGKEDDRRRRRVRAAESELAGLKLGAGGREGKASPEAEAELGGGRTSVWYGKSFWRKRYGVGST